MNDGNALEQSLDHWIDAHMEEIIARTQEFLRIPSVGGPETPGARFGTETRRALDFALGLAETHGLTIKHFDGYAGHAEWAGTEPNREIVGILAHVDVVPAGDNWKHPPFAAEIEDGRIYARGAIDDKGPAMAALFALLAIKECDVPTERRVRVILGASEETGDYPCLRHYFSVEEMPALGFTPDGLFPVIYAEKGIATITVQKRMETRDAPIRVISMTAGRMYNMVPDSAEAVLASAHGTWLAASTRLNAVVGVRTEEDGQGRLKVVAQGVSAHASTPDKGVNAIGILCDALLMLGLGDDQKEFLRMIGGWASDTTGAALGIAGQDEIVGSLTSNLGILSYPDNNVSLTFNIRYPVLWSRETLLNKFQSGMDAAGFVIDKVVNSDPLYVPADDPLVTTLLDVYREATGDRQPPVTIGGGTYARVMKNCVAFGPEFPGAPGPGAHEADECWAIADLIRATKIYAKAILRLSSPSLQNAGIAG